MKTSVLIYRPARVRPVFEPEILKSNSLNIKMLQKKNNNSNNITGIWFWGVKSNKVIPHPGTLLSPSTAHPLQIEICKKKNKKSSPCFPPQSNSPCCLCKAAQLKLQSEPHRLHSMTELCGPQGCQSLLRQGTCRLTFFFIYHYLTQHYLIFQQQPS